MDIISIAAVIIIVYLAWSMLAPIRRGNANLASAYEELTKPAPVAASILSNNWVTELKQAQAKLQEEANK